MNMKMEWIEPKIEVQKFVAEEYVAVCWGVACAWQEANNYEASINNSAQEHREGHCGTQTNQWVIDDNGDNIVDRMIETGTDGLGNLTCTLYTDNSYSTTASFSGVGINSYIYWTTTAGGRTWHHQGKVMGTDASHPNRS